MGIGNIAYMDVVSDAGAIAGIVIVTEYGHFRALTDCGLGDDGYYAFAHVLELTDQCGRVGAYGIEVTEEYGVEMLVDVAEVAANGLPDLLGAGIGRFGLGEGGIFYNGSLCGIAVYGAGRREDKIIYIKFFGAL